MPFSDNSMIGAVLGTFFSTLILTSVVVAGLFYLLYIKLKVDKSDKQRSITNYQQAKAQHDSIFLCKSHSNKLSFNIVAIDNKTSVLVTLDHTSIKDESQLKSIELYFDYGDTTNPEEIEKMFSTIGNLPMRLKLTNDCLKQLPNDTHEDEDKCHVCVRNSLERQSKTNQEDITSNDNSNITPPNQSSFTSTIDQKQPAEKPIVRNHSSVKSNSPSEDDLVIVVDNTILSKDVRYNPEDGMEECSDPPPTFEIPGRWSNMDMGAVIKEKTTKGGLSYYVDMEASD